jgi:Na+/H+ antiporter
MQHFETIIFVLTILICLLTLANKFNLPNPVLLVTGGLIIGFIPGMPIVSLNPEVVFLIFLPPILYNAASNTSWHDFKSEIKPISTLAIALVFFTTLAVAIFSHWMIPGFSWPLAFVLGAIVSPPDAVAATSITKGLGLNRKVITILEGESLVNDASALIALRFAIAAVGTGTFIFWKAGISFLTIVAGGIVIGGIVGYLFINVHKRILNNSIISTALTLLTPFISYLVAEHFAASGVLAVVSSGLLISWRASDIFSYQTRLRNQAVWDTLIFLLNGFIFILIGLQLPEILRDLSRFTVLELTTYGLIVSAVTIAVRILWVFAAAFSSRGKTFDKDANTWKNVAIVAWSGGRGVVSLATALAIPLTINAQLFPLRSLILFLTFVVIFVTLVIQGLSLPLLIKMLGVKPHTSSDSEERDLRLLLASSTISFIDNDFPFMLNSVCQVQIKKPHLDITDLLSSEQQERLPAADKSAQSNLLAAQMEIRKFQRKFLSRCQKDKIFSQAVLRRLERELDLADLQLSSKVRKRK